MRADELLKNSIEVVDVGRVDVEGCWMRDIIEISIGKEEKGKEKMGESGPMGEQQGHQTSEGRGSDYGEGGGGGQSLPCDGFQYPGGWFTW